LRTNFDLHIAEGPSLPSTDDLKNWVRLFPAASALAVR
jgi:hypothetical protein